MKKNNKKGFAIAEILAVTVVIMVIFVTVYSNFFPTTAEFERRVAYNDLESLYATYYMRQLYNDYFQQTSFSGDYAVLYDGKECKNLTGNDKNKCKTIAEKLGIQEMIVSTNNIEGLKGVLKNIDDSKISSDLKKYIKYLPKASITGTNKEELRIILKTESGYATSLLKYEAPKEANKPELTSNLLPVKYDDAGSLVVATKDDSDWYNYDEGRWANAVTIKETAREKYFDSDGYVIANDETEVEESDINTMWVWIPRYKYSLFNYNAEGTSSVAIQSINIEFESGTEKTGTITCRDLDDYDTDTAIDKGISEICKYNIDDTVIDNDNQTTYQGANNTTPATYTHPAFTFGDTELTGIWVGKFENSTDNLQKNNASTLTETGAITILPDSKTYIGFTMYEAYQAIREMELNNNPYGFTQEGSNVEYSKVYKNGNVYVGTDQLNNDNNSLDTHMMKNSEWGAVTYLALSKYGIYNIKNGGFEVKPSTSKLQAKVEIENYSDACSNDVCNTGSIGAIRQSTTRNYYGIYDMSGGVPELVMGSTTGNKFGLKYGSAGIWSHKLYGGGKYTEDYVMGQYLSESKYYDSYVYNYKYDDMLETKSNDLKVKLGKLGDATKEVSWKIEKDSKLEGWLPTTNTKGVPYGGGNNIVVFSRGLDSIVYFTGSDGRAKGVEKIGSRSVLVIIPNTNGGKL